MSYEQIRCRIRSRHTVSSGGIEDSRIEAWRGQHNELVKLIMRMSHLMTESRREFDVLPVFQRFGGEPIGDDATFGAKNAISVILGR